jgi:hypothetical protein
VKITEASPRGPNQPISAIVSFAAGPETLGMRPEAVELMRQQFGALRNVYQLFVARTGLRLREVERLLAE